ncbi:hypothetical protein DPMN_088086 [Dreissena polymorpha]|uniref:Uncharacterized protein n=1 Tax=Dreissena polymorpha TaxID=45954 RepID=A0A9D4KTH5_DREPO|nr:hypothetical protein DPMN_088086 [Dreissena polymorpha]
MGLWDLHGVLDSPGEGPGVDDAGARQKSLTLVVKQHGVDTLLSGPLLIVCEYLWESCTFINQFSC